MLWVSIAVGIVFGALGAAAERLASVWPADEAARRPIGLRTIALAGASGAAAAAIVARSALPWWATAVYLLLLVPLVVLSATDLEQRRLPHIVLDPLILGAAAFVPFNPGWNRSWRSSVTGAAVGFLVSCLVVRGGLAVGDLYLVAPSVSCSAGPRVHRPVRCGVPAAATSLLLLATTRVGMRSYIPVGPFLIRRRRAGLLVDAHARGRPLARRFDPARPGWYPAAMHPALQRRRRHLMMTRRPRVAARSDALATFLLITLGVFGLMFAGSIWSQRAGCCRVHLLCLWPAGAGRARRPAAHPAEST